MAAPPASAATTRPRRIPSAPPRFLQALNLALFLSGVLVIVFVINFFALRPEYRRQIDATKTRAYSLSPQTVQLLANLEGQWTIALLFSEHDLRSNVRRQIDEVLKRFTDASDRIDVVRIDPAAPSTLVKYDALLSQLNAVYAQEISAYEAALDEGMAAFNDLHLFAQQRAGELAQVVSRLPPAEQGQDSLAPRAQLLSILADQGHMIAEQVDKARRVDEGHPTSDYETARSVLAEVLTQWAAQLDEIAAIFEKWLSRADMAETARQFAGHAQTEYEQTALRLAQAADPLKRLPPMELGAIGAQLAQGEAALIIGPKRAAVIPPAQLFPKTNLQQKNDGGVSFDTRFRGEQIISATMRSLIVPHMPRVVFVHAEAKSLLQPRERQADLVGLHSVLRAARFDVKEWMMAEQATRPESERGQPTVWVIIPPVARSTLEPSQAETRLLAETERLLSEGENVLLSVYPSLAAKYGQTDRWAELLADFGIRIDTSRTICEIVQVAAGKTETQRGVALREYSDAHLIARALENQQTYLSLPVAIQAAPAATSRHDVIAAVKPDDDRWLETDWAADNPQRSSAEAAERFDEPLPVVMTAERRSPTAVGSQRVIAVGSGGWMLSFVADVVVGVGGERVALVNPGNYELMLASVAWLAGMDDLIAATPMSQEIQRLSGITPAVRQRWFWIVVAGVPVCCVIIGLLVALRRRV